MTWSLSSTSDIDTTLYIEFNSLIMSIKMHHQNFVNINEFTIYVTQTQTVLTLRITQQRKGRGNVLQEVNFKSIVNSIECWEI